MISFFRTSGMVLDRYIVLDHGTKDMKIYLCGSSSKDSGKKITTILQVKDTAEYQNVINSLLLDPPLVLI